ncbi:21770_t:CDS:1, partial [Entrophospora sp. SA101]
DHKILSSSSTVFASPISSNKSSSSSLPYFSSHTSSSCSYLAYT